jgi:glycoprotein-N-acetylgalactosamine 3-beta-galactosyltransferase
MTVYEESSQLAKPVKIFCGIYTMLSSHETNVKSSRDTWGKRCDGFVAFSTHSDKSIPALKIEHEGEEAYDNMWQKSRSIWKYVANHFMNDFDFFLMGGDDMMYIIENLRLYLGSSKIQDMSATQTGLFIGRRFWPKDKRGRSAGGVFNGGGPGYILDKKALAILRDNIDSPKCYPHQRGFWEDVNVANCLNKSAGIEAIDTRDSDGGERFNPFSPGVHLTYRIDHSDSMDWYPKFNPYLKEGLACCAKDGISFHYIKGELLRSLMAYLYVCNNKKLTNNFIK